MTINRTLSSLIALGAWLLLVGESSGATVTAELRQCVRLRKRPLFQRLPGDRSLVERPTSLLPFGPVGFVHKWDPFAPADISDLWYGPQGQDGVLLQLRALLLVDFQAGTCHGR